MTKVTGVVFTDDQRRWIRARADQLDRPVSWVIRRLVQDMIEAEAAEKPAATARPTLRARL
jgi:hypothetical protein